MDEKEVDDFCSKDCHRIFLEEFRKAQSRKLESEPRFEAAVSRI
jgi:hypothetical protein